MATLWQKARLLRGLIDGEVAFGGPFYVDVDVTQRCNMYCLGCRYHSPRTSQIVASAPSGQDVPFERIDQLCDQLPPLGTSEIILAGAGEPLLHPQLCDIISAFKDAGCTVQLYTNGTLIDRAFARAILESRLDILRVSLWASSIDEYRLCHPGVSPDSFERSLNGIKAVAHLKAASGSPHPKLLLTQPLNRHNFAGIGARVRLAHDLGCDGVAFTAYRDGRGESVSAALSAEQIQDVSRQLRYQRKAIESLSLQHNIDRLLLRYRLGESTWRTMPCYAGWFHTHIRVDGTVLPCGLCSLSMGNLRDTPFGDIWNGHRYRAFRRQASSLGGLASVGSDCDCRWCCYARDNLLVYRFGKWVGTLQRKGD